MFDRIFDFIAEFVDFFQFFVTVDHYEQGVVLTLGKFRGRVLDAGLHFIWPFNIDQVFVDNVVPTTTNLEAQKLTTADGVTVMIGVALRWKIRDITKVLLTVEDVDSVLDDSTYGEIASYVAETNWADLNNDWCAEVHAAVRKRAFRFGIEVEELWITDLVRTVVLCLVK